MEEEIFIQKKSKMILNERTQKKNKDLVEEVVIKELMKLCIIVIYMMNQFNSINSF